MMGDCTAICTENGMMLPKIQQHGGACNYHNHHVGTGMKVKDVMVKYAGVTLSLVEKNLFTVAFNLSI